MFKKGLFAFLTIWAGIQVAHADETMIYKNQRGSLLEITIRDDNQVTGYFTTAVASNDCPQAVGSRQEISGYSINNVIALSIAYPMCGSVLSINGHFTASKEKIETLALLAHQAKDIHHEGPGAQFIVHDSFTKVTA